MHLSCGLHFKPFAGLGILHWQHWTKLRVNINYQLAFRRPFPRTCPPIPRHHLVYEVCRSQKHHARTLDSQPTHSYEAQHDNLGNHLQYPCHPQYPVPRNPEWQWVQFGDQLYCINGNAMERVPLPPETASPSGPFCTRGRISETPDRRHARTFARLAPLSVSPPCF